MAASTRALALPCLLVFALASGCLADGDPYGNGRSKDARLLECQSFWYRLEVQLEECYDGLAGRVSAAPAGSTSGSCPQACRGVVKDMPTYCGRQLEPALASTYNFSLLDSSGRPVSFCTIFCGSDAAQQCRVEAAQLPRLNVLHQLHEKDSTLWALVTNTKTNSSSGSSSAGDSSSGGSSGSSSGSSGGSSGSGSSSGNSGSGSRSGSSGSSGSGDSNSGSDGQQENATAAGAPAEPAPAADDDGGSGLNVAAVAAGTTVGALALGAAGLALWHVRQARRRRRQPAAAAIDEADTDGKSEPPDLEAGWPPKHDQGPDAKQPPPLQQSHRALVDSAATSASGVPPAAVADAATAPGAPAAAVADAATAGSSAAAGPPRAAPDGLEGLAALWAQAAQAAAPAAAAPGAAAAGAAVAGAAAAAGALAAGAAAGGAPAGGANGGEPAGRQPQDSAYQGQQPQQGSNTGGAAEVVDDSSAVVLARGSGELAAPSTPAGALLRGASRRSSHGMSTAGSAAMDLDRWEVDFSAISLVRLLGEGSCGSVYLATLNETAVAVKLLAGSDPAAASRGSWRSSPALQALHKESSLMASLRHPNVVLFLGISYEPPAIVSEYCARGSLFDVLRAASMSEAAAASLSWPRRLRLALDAAKGMLALHSHQPPIIHRDLKSPNLLVDGAWRVKVADFNLSKLLEDTGVRSTSLGGMLNPRWLAPEVLTGGSATAASDTFSMGVVLWELMTWTIPWGDRNPFQLVHMISAGERLPLPAREAVAGAAPPDPELYDAYVALLRRCWAQQPQDRPGFAEIIQDLRAMMAYVLGPSETVA